MFSNRNFNHILSLCYKTIKKKLIKYEIFFGKVASVLQGLKDPLKLGKSKFKTKNPIKKNYSIVISLEIST